MGGELGGLCLTMGHLLNDTPVDAAWVEKGVPVYVYHGLGDKVIPWEGMSEPSYTRLWTAGVDVHTVLEEDVEHGDGEREKAWTRSFLSDVMKPASKAKKASVPRKQAGSKVRW